MPPYYIFWENVVIFHKNILFWLYIRALLLLILTELTNVNIFVRATRIYTKPSLRAMVLKHFSFRRPLFHS